MSYYVGIDLGTTNSVISTFDGKTTKIWKSPEMNDVTPSAIYIDKRGNRFYGRRAYEMAPINDKNAAILFKRYMGTNRVFQLRDIEMTPEECSAEILRVLFGYLPAEIASDPETAIVITVPAAFNQMKKDATLEAARLAGIGKVTLMQEPVAAVMSVIKKDPGEKRFLIYDLGGGTFDISLAEAIGGRVNLLAQGGKEMCGGRDWDRLIFQKIAVPWLKDHFHLPDNFETDPAFRNLTRLTIYACEQAKIELSSMDQTDIRMDEMRMNVRDMDGEEIYLDIPIACEDMNQLIEDNIQDTIDVTRETIKKVGLTPEQISQIVFIGGPTKYKPLREKVTAELGISIGVDVEPMTAVAEGASIFAETIDWSDKQHHRKAVRNEIATAANVKVRYEKRTSASFARIMFLSESEQTLSLELNNMETGWTTGRAELTKKCVLSVPLDMAGENSFHLQIWDENGHKIPLDEENIVITRTMATIGSIPASSPIAIKVLDKVGGKAVPVYLVEENDTLPKSGQVAFYAGQVLHAGSKDALVFTLWEGGIKDPIEDNRYIGTYRISGMDIPEGSIPTGGEIICDYEMSDSGSLYLGVSIPSLGIKLSDRNFYSRQEGQTAIDDAPRMLSQIESMERRTADIGRQLNGTPEVVKLQDKLYRIRELVEHTEDPEDLQQANNEILESLRSLAKIRQHNRLDIRKMELNQMVERFYMFKQVATPMEIAAFERLKESALRSIDRDNGDFDTELDEMKLRISALLWKQDDIIELNFMQRIARPGNFRDPAKFDQLRARGLVDIKAQNFGDLRIVLGELMSIEKVNTDIGAEHMFDHVNVVRK